MNQQTRDQKPEADDMTARTLGWVTDFDSTVDDEQFELIRAGWDTRATSKYGPKDIFGFRSIPSGNGVDAYYTRVMDDSLDNYARQLPNGLAVLGNHDYGTFSYGASYAGEVVDADPTRPEYESTFYSKHGDREALKTTRWVIGSYYMVRGVTLNNQSSDDLIKAIEMGAVRRQSVSFTVGRYACSIDGFDFIDMGFFGMWPDEDAGCAHFPGLEYSRVAGDPSELCVANMHGNDLLETSWVYRNASPSAMLLRRAEALARSGVIDARQVATIEERYRVRLPAFTRQVHPRGKEDVSVANARTTETTPEDVPETPPEVIEPPAPPEPVEPAGEPTEPADTPDASPPAASVQRLALLEARDTALRTAAGEDVTPELIRSLTERAKLGDDLFAQYVDQAVRAKVRARGEKVNAERYRKHLMASRDLEWIGDEIATFDEEAKAIFVPGPQVTRPEPPREPRSARSNGEKPDSNLLAATGGRQARKED